MLRFGANLMKFDRQIKYLARGAVRAGNYSLNFRLGPGNTHTRRKPVLSFFNERNGTTSAFPMCLFLDFMRAASILF